MVRTGLRNRGHLYLRAEHRHWPESTYRQVASTIQTSRRVIVILIELFIVYTSMVSFPTAYVTTCRYHFRVVL